MVFKKDPMKTPPISFPSFFLRGNGHQIGRTPKISHVWWPQESTCFQLIEQSWLQFMNHQTCSRSVDVLINTRAFSFCCRTLVLYHTQIISGTMLTSIAPCPFFMSSMICVHATKQQDHECIIQTAVFFAHHFHPQGFTDFLCRKGSES